jgi:hypothetical protein
MARPLMQHGVGQLEEIFARGMADTKVLKQLEQELQYRQVPRAVALLAEVQAAMYGGATTPQSAAVPAPPPAARAPAPLPQPPGLGEHPATPPIATPPTVVPVRAVAPTVRLPEPLPAARPPAPAMPLDDAYKVLKTAPGTTWESIERTRRLLVQQSSPLRTSTMGVDKRARALAEARRINEAYMALFTGRTSGR